MNRIFLSLLAATLNKAIAKALKRKDSFADDKKAASKALTALKKGVAS